MRTMFGLVMLLLLVTAAAGFAEDDVAPVGFTAEHRIVSKPEGSSGTVQLWMKWIATGRCPDCSELTFHVRTVGDLIVDGPNEWTAPVSKDDGYEKVVSVTVPENDTCQLDVAAHTGALCLSGGVRVFFISTGDTMEVHFNQIRAADPRSSNQKAADETEAMLTEEQLNYEYDVKFFLTEDFKWEMDLVDSVAGPLKAGNEEGVYYGRIKKRGILHLLRHGIGCQKLTPEYPDIQRMSDSVAALRFPPPLIQLTQINL